MFLAAAMLTLSTLAGDAAFDEGVQLYKSLEYEAALARFAELSARPELAAPDKAEALVWLGLCLAGTGDLDAAKRTFKAALSADANAALPTTTAVSPRVQAHFAEAAAEARSLVPPPPPPPPPPVEGAAPLPLLPGGLLALGVVAAGGGAVLAGLAVDSLQQAENPDAFQDEAKAALDAANAQGVSAGILIAAGVAMAATGVALFFVE
ncbi:MAG: hypothetical protein IT382_07430 [Deltaproteobacteria bacterium]|nr:hypothetical protein [Deltaproteobacteria bacterium]